MGKQITVCLNIRRYDLMENPECKKECICLDSTLDYDTLKKYLYNYFNVSMNHYVIKLRNTDEYLIPLGELLKEEHKYLILDICKIKYTDVHTRVIHAKFESLLKRLDNLEEMSKDVEWRKQSHIEENLNILMDKMDVMNRRFDLLLTPALKQEIK